MQSLKGKTQRIPITQLQPGMYLVGVDRSWLSTPFFSHKRLIKSEKEISQLKECGVREVIIDLARGRGTDGGSDDTHVEWTSSAPTENLETFEVQDDELAQDSKEQGGHPRIEDPLSQAPAAGEDPFPSDPSSHTQEVLPSPVSPPWSGPTNGPADPSKLNEPEVDQTQLTNARVILNEGVIAVEALFEGVKTGAPIDAIETRRVVTSLLSQVLGCSTPLFHHLRLQALRQFERSIYQHVVDVCVMALVLGVESDMDRPSLEELGIGALLHDIGYLRLPRNMLRKRIPYTQQELRVKARHPELGRAILSESPDLPDTVCQIVLEHHERPDGSGYPQGLKGSQVSHGARIVGIVDYYDTMVSAGEGQPPIPPAHGVRELYQLGRQERFFPSLVEQLIRIIGVYPVGSFVELNTGERGVVVGENLENETKPILRIILDQQKSTHYLLDLSQPGIDPPRRITRILDLVKENIRLVAYLEP